MPNKNFHVTLTKRELDLLTDALLGKIEAVTKTRMYLGECPDAMNAVKNHYRELQNLNTKLCKLGEEAKNRIVILVEGGIIQSVLSDTKDVSVEVIDLDADDEEEADWSENASAAAEAEVASGSLCVVY